MALQKEKAHTLETGEKRVRRSTRGTASSGEKRPVRRRASTLKQVNLTFQYQGQNLTQGEMVERVRSQLGEMTLTTLELYIKPEDRAIYYVANDTHTGKLDL